MTITLVTLDRIDAVWPFVSDGFDKAALKTGGDITAGELWQGCRRGTFFLFVVHDDEAIKAASVWQPQTWQTGHKLRCLALYGAGMKDWIDDMHRAARELAVNCGATAIVSEGRVGWKPIFPNAKPLRILYEEPI